MAQSHIVNQDRFITWVVVAAVLHGILIWGVSFVNPAKSQATKSLDVTLSVQDDKERNDEADFIAQTNQQGSGTELEVLAPQTNKLSELQSNQVQNNTNQSLMMPANQQVEQFYVSVVASDWALPTQEQTSEAIEEFDGEDSELSLPEQAESLRAKLREQVQMLASQPKQRILTAASTKSADEAEYLNNWLTMVEEIGNQNYPAEATRRQLEGVVRVMVVIYPDGSLKGMEISESSGYSVLDEAAKRIVRLAEPFPAFTPSMNEFDELAIIRSWKFEVNLSLDK